MDPSRCASAGVIGVEGDAFHAALTSMFDAFLRVLDRGTVDSRILFIHEFLTQLLQVGVEPVEYKRIAWVKYTYHTTC